VCVGQNELVMSLFEVFDLYLALKWRSKSNIEHKYSYMCCYDQSW
jgi:hypothetical protein